MPEAKDCRCYVQFLRPEARMVLHWGAHSLRCPVYRPSLDPVDRAHDEEFRYLAELAPPEVINRKMSKALELS